MNVIKIEHLWKEYRLGVISHGTLTYDLQSWLARIRGKEDPNSKIQSLINQGKQVEGSHFWALREVNLEIKQGEVVGIIGRNGAGKSTLLKILSRVTAPTSGQIKIKGRIASLLEVGTGFHPELTGKENIFMNGAMLGMARHEIKSKLDEIIEFAEVSEFVDTPVKRYSSGMYVRLAFAVAAHLEPEILVVDEVLAVGDAEFQKKCLGKMGEVSKAGRTVLFVSHNMGAVNRLCSRSICLQNGMVASEGETATVIKKYLHGGENNINIKEWIANDAPGNRHILLRAIRIANQNNETTDILEIDQIIVVEITIEAKIGYQMLGIGCVVRNGQGETIIHSSSTVSMLENEVMNGIWVFKMEIPPALLNIGSYSVSVSSDVPNKEKIFVADSVLGFEIVSMRKSTSLYNQATWKGVLSPEVVSWNKIQIQ